MSDRKMNIASRVSKATSYRSLHVRRVASHLQVTVAMAKQA